MHVFSISLLICADLRMNKNLYKQIMTRLIYAWIILFALILLLIFNLFVLSGYLKTYKLMVNEQVRLLEFTYQSELVSSSLTNSVRYFARTFDPTALSLYLIELKKVRKIDEYIIYLKKLHGSPQELQYFLNTKKIAESIRENEIKSIKLILTAYKADNSITPDEIQNYYLSPQEMALTADEKLNLAHELVQKRDYLSKKEQITRLIREARTTINDRTAANIQTVEEKIDFRMLYLKFTAFFALCLVIIIVWIRALSIRRLLH